MTASKGDLLVIASSARMLAQSARHGGWSPLAVDLFDDMDTRACSRKNLKIENLSLDAIETACRSITRERIPLVYGSGLDNHPNWVVALRKHFRICGNTPETLAAVRDPEHFFQRLCALGVPFPETRFSCPDSLGEWLIKSACGEGGMRVAFLANFLGASSESHYFQRFTPGAPCSLLFLANGKIMRPIGFNTQLTTPQTNLPFLFSGAINDAPLGPEERRTAEQIAATLTEEFGLMGLNSLDFVAGPSGIRVLEINPRPGSTAQIHDYRFPNGWLDAHVLACEGELIDTKPVIAYISGFQIVYATTETTIGARMTWPDYCSDRPQPGRKIPAGQPICTVIAAGLDQASVLITLSERTQAIYQQLGLTANETISATH